MPDLVHTVQVLSKTWLTHDVIQLHLEKPAGFTFQPGQAVEVTLDEPSFSNDAAPFTLTSLPDAPHLELILKVYPRHQGMTQALSETAEGARLLISHPWDSFPYRGPGVFIAGGAGITAFIPIIRSLSQQGQLTGHQLIWANRKHRDIFLEEEWQTSFGRYYSNILSKARSREHSFGRIHSGYLKQKIPDFEQYFYICGPGTFPDDVKAALLALGAPNEKVSIAY